MSDVLVVDIQHGHWSFMYDESTCVHVKMIDNMHESTASWVVAVGSAVASSILSRNKQNEQDKEDESASSSHPDFKKLYASFSSGHPEVGIVQKVNIRHFDFVSSAVFIDRFAKVGSLCLIDNILVLAPSYVGYLINSYITYLHDITKKNHS